MKKLLPITIILGAILILITCMRNDIYNNAKDNLYSLILMIKNNTDGNTSGTTEPTAIYIYSYVATVSGKHGAFGGRTGTDSLCQSISPPASTTTVHSFISDSTLNMIDLVPSVYWSLPVYDSTGTNQISPTWTALWDTNIDRSLTDAGVLSAGTQWWSGSDRYGTNIGNNCNDWTSPVAGTTGMTGFSDSVDFKWVEGAIPPNCNQNCYLLCVAY